MPPRWFAENKAPEVFTTPGALFLVAGEGGYAQWTEGLLLGSTGNLAYTCYALAHAVYSSLTTRLLGPWLNLPRKGNE